MKHHSPISQVHRAPVTLQFANNVARIVKRHSNSPYRLRKASWDRITPILAEARKNVTLTDDGAIRRVLLHNPDAGRLVYDHSNKSDFGIFAYLPLNARGAMALVSGGLNGAAPDTDLICRAGETPIAIYIWLTFALDGKFVGALPAMFQCLDELAPDGCPVFSRAAHDYSARLWARMGMFPATKRYPGAPDWLIMTEPKSNALPAETANAQNIEVRCVQTIDEFMQVVAVRSAVYIAEQLCRYDEEFDGNDFCGTQLLGLVNGDAAGCARLRYFGEFAKLERIAVRPQYRSTKLARELMRAAIEHCRLKGFRQMYGHARRDLVPYYRRFGCKPVEGRPPFAFANVEYQEIALDLEAHEDAIDRDGDPMILVRPEGHWDELCTLELSIAAGTDDQRAAVDSSIRRLRG